MTIHETKGIKMFRKNGKSALGAAKYGLSIHDQNNHNRREK
jgi:hypothetical protein